MTGLCITSYVQLALSQVPASDREAVELAYFGGFTQAEIARMTGTPGDSAKSRIRERLIVLRDVMRAQDVSAPTGTRS